MKIYSRVEIDIASGKVEHAEWEEYDGPLALCEGGYGGYGDIGLGSGSFAGGGFGYGGAAGQGFGEGLGLGGLAIGVPSGAAAVGLGAYGGGDLGIGGFTPAAGSGVYGGPGGGMLYPGSASYTNPYGSPYLDYGIGYGQGLGAPYPTTTPAAASAYFQYPTSQEVYDTVQGLPYLQNQNRILRRMGNMQSFRSAVLPEVQGVMKTLGRSGYASSSMADRAITETLGSLYNKWMWNVLTGYQNIGVQMPNMMNQWYQPYDKMLAYVS